MQSVDRLPYSGAIDADGHVLEPPDLWERYLEGHFKERALRIKRNSDGMEYLEIDGRASQLWRGGFLAALGQMGNCDAQQFKLHSGKGYVASAPFGAMDSGERIRLLDAQNLSAALLYPTLGILWEAETEDILLTQAYCRAYNRWIADFCRDSQGRLVPVAHLSLSDVAMATKELERATADGCRGAFVVPFTLDRKPHGHPDHDRLFAAAQALNVPLAIHPAFEPATIASRRYDQAYPARLLGSLMAGEGVRHAFTTLFDFGVFERFPGLKIVVTEAGAGWIGHWMDRLDSVFEGTFMRSQIPLAEKPSVYFRRQCFVSIDPGENILSGLINHFGYDRFFWASDYPHPDHSGDYIRALEHSVRGLTENARDALLGANVRRHYNIN
jgi:predicted TIM-barrel fold metal-dependent hydrolase